MNIDILIPLYVDHEDRISNLERVITILKSYGIDSIYVREYYKTNSKYSGDGCNYSSVCLQDDNFNKMKCVNEMVDICSNPFLAVYDVDVVVFKRDLLDAIQMLETNYNVIYPYNGQFLNIPKPLIDSFMSERTVNPDKCELCNPNSYGGCVIYKREAFIEGGKCNPNFKNVGFDDNELFIRFQKLGYKIGRTTNPILHLDHHRSETSVEHSVYLQHNMSIYNHICSVSVDELREEIKTWK